MAAVCGAFVDPQEVIDQKSACLVTPATATGSVAENKVATNRRYGLWSFVDLRGYEPTRYDWDHVGSPNDIGVMTTDATVTAEEIDNWIKSKPDVVLRQTLGTDNTAIVPCFRWLPPQDFDDAKTIWVVDEKEMGAHLRSIGDGLEDTIQKIYTTVKKHMYQNDILEKESAAVSNMACHMGKELPVGDASMWNNALSDRCKELLNEMKLVGSSINEAKKQLEQSSNSLKQVRALLMASTEEKKNVSVLVMFERSVSHEGHRSTRHFPLVVRGPSKDILQQQLKWLVNESRLSMIIHGYGACYPHKLRVGEEFVDLDQDATFQTWLVKSRQSETEKRVALLKAQQKTIEDELNKMSSSTP